MLTEPHVGRRTAVAIARIRGVCMEAARSQCDFFAGADAALRYVRDRVNVPRDMSLHAARRLRTALEETAALAGSASGPPIPSEHRRDQDPTTFRRAVAAR